MQSCETNSSRPGGKIERIIMPLLFAIAAACFCVYPFLNTLTGFSQRRIISSSLSAQSDIGSDTLADEITRSEAYNEAVYEDQQFGKYGYLGASATDETYDSLWRFDAAGTICTVEVPSVSINLPVLHGTQSDELQYAAGHMYGSSLPVGGINTKAVIAAHTGLSNASLFTNLDRVKEGDPIYIHIGTLVHGYRISRIDVFAKGEEKQACKIDAGEDEVVLYTCTPRGINDHRLLVTGVRDSSLDYVDDRTNSGDSSTSVTVSAMAVAKLIGLACIPVAVFIISHRLLFGKKKQKPEKS